MADVDQRPALVALLGRIGRRSCGHRDTAALIGRDS
jgi:hypothetical protein